MKHYIFGFTTAAFIFLYQIAMTQPPVGKPVPAFQFENVQQYNTKVVNNEHYKGKWLYLDFFSRICLNCVKDIGKTDSLYKSLKHDMNFLMVVNTSESAFGKRVDKEVIERLYAKQKFTFPYVYDSLQHEKWEFYSAPHIVIIDPGGVVRVVSNGSDVNLEKLQKLIRGERVSFYQKEVMTTTSATTLPQLFPSNLSVWAPEKLHVKIPENMVGFATERQSLTNLFLISRTGGKIFWGAQDTLLYETIYPYPALEIPNPEFVQGNGQTGYGFYDYFVAIDKSKYSDEAVWSALYTDLQRFTGLQAKFEWKEVPVLALVARPGAAEKLKTKGGKPGDKISGSMHGDAAGFAFDNFPFSALYNRIIHYWPEHLPIYNETGIKSNIDIVFDALMVDSAQVLRELNRNGLDLVRKERRMKVLVIRPISAN